MATVREAIKYSIDAAVSGLPWEDSARALLSKTAIFPTFRGHHAMVRIMGRVLEADSHTVDAGANDGSVLKHLLRLAPKGEHEAFEPQPDLMPELHKKFGKAPNVHLHNRALGDEEGSAQFTEYTSASRLSTFFPRPEFLIHSPKVIEVEVTTLDSALLPSRLDFLKVDVEGSELQVFQGGQRRLAEEQPYVVFEHNLDAMQAAGVSSDDVFRFLQENCGLAVYSLHNWLDGGEPLSAEELNHRAHSTEKDFLAAHPDSHRATPSRR